MLTLHTSFRDQPIAGSKYRIQHMLAAALQPINLDRRMSCEQRCRGKTTLHHPGTVQRRKQGHLPTES